jgi:multiple sugar transport system substrate-binding protein
MSTNDISSEGEDADADRSAEESSGSGGTVRRRRFMQAGAAGALTTGLAGCVSSLGGGGGPVTVRFLNSSYEQEQEAYENLFETFEEEQDNVEVEYTRVDFAKAPQKAAQAHAADEPYDVMSLASPGNNVTAVAKGLFQPINDVIEDMGGSDHWFEKILIPIDGDYYFASNSGSVINHIWRKDIFEEHGAPTPPFENWNDFKTAAETLTNPDDNLYGFPIFLGNNHFHGVFPMCLGLGNGGHLVDENGKIVFDSPEMVEMLQLYKDLNQYSPKSAHGASIPNMRPPLYKGNYAMTWYSSNRVPYDIEEYNPDLSPSNNGGEPLVKVSAPPSAEGHEPVSRMTGIGYGLSSKTQVPEEAKALIKHITKQESIVELMLAEPATSVPTVKGVLDQDRLWESEMLTKYEDHYRDLVSIGENYGRIIAVEENKGSISDITGRALSETFVVGAIQDVIINDTEPQKAASKAADKMRSEMTD